MLHILSLDDGLDIFKALGSEIRVEIVKLLLENKSMNMNELANKLNITNGALTSHIKKLESCGIVTTSNESAGHGNQKICSIHVDKILIELQPPEESENVYNTEVKVGHYSDYNVYPTCGLATPNVLIGEVDDPRYFAHPDRYNADIEIADAQRLQKFCVGAVTDLGVGHNVQHGVDALLFLVHRHDLMAELVQLLCDMAAKSTQADQ